MVRTFCAKPNMSISPLEYLRHILDEARYLSEESQHFTKAQFIVHETAEGAFVRSIEIIGEATKKIPAGCEKYPLNSARPLRIQMRSEISYTCG